MEYGILVINPGSTSDDIGCFLGDKLVFDKIVRYNPGDLKPFEKQKVTAQYEFRKTFLLKALRENGVALSSLHAAIGRGGLINPVPSGVYEVDEKLAQDLRQGVMGDHPSNLGGLLAKEVADIAKIPAFIADPVVVDEMNSLARYSGMPENPRISIFHALNQKRVGMLAAGMLGKAYEDINLIIMHGGGGISVGAHCKGRVIDVNNALDGEGPFTPQRSGGVPAGGLAKMCFSGNYTIDDIKLKIKGRGGLVAYTGTSDITAIKKFISGQPAPAESGLDKRNLTPEKAREILQAMAYQIAKEIGALAAALKGRVDAIALTGGIAYDTDIIVPEIKARVGWIAPVLEFPGGDEKRALREAAARALEDPRIVKKY